MPSETRPRSNWKVIVVVDISGAKPRWYGKAGARFKAQPFSQRLVYSQRNASNAWRIFWHFHGAQHVIGGPELWQGKRLVMGLPLSSPDEIINRLTYKPRL